MERVRRVLRPITVPSDPDRSGNICVRRDHRKNHGCQIGHIIRRPRRGLRNVVVTLDRRVVARVGLITPTFGICVAETAANHAPAASISAAPPLDSSSAVTIAADHHTAGEERVGQPETDQAEPCERELNSIASHLGWCGAAEYMGLIEWDAECG